MKAWKAFAAGLLALGVGGTAAEAAILVKVDKTAQRMTVEVDGRVAHVWPVSTARSGYSTPSGSYRPVRMHRMWYSQKYDLSPMPHAIFFSGGYAIHGTGATGQLGRPASHGCVRLAPGNAATLYALVQSHGKGATRIQLYGNPRHPAPAVASRHNKRGPRLAQRLPVPRRSAYYISSAPIAPAYDPRLFSGSSVRPVRYVQSGQGSYGYAGRGGAYQARAR